ncbi:alpha/beta hydrolase [Nocardia panacis]|uniref:Alpha/beta hydrolase n=1 Tax=Nocardia panacis TaxID=2340916 RepID=A0A3A4KCI6_9NOCA|nr:lipase family protein [Nocardia panacis]RJO76371.1 alpha/beta hydrolase [Nocardia panacis]
MGIFRGCRIAVAVAAGAALVVGGGRAAADAPGTLGTESAQPDGWHGMSGGSVLTYWTEGSDGAPRPVSGALFVPAGTPPPGGWPIAAFDHGTTGLGRGCGGKSDPATAPNTVFTAEEDGMMQHLVNQGFAVVAPDYLGLGLFDTGPHPYLELRTEATATIDLVRAARSAHPELSRTWVSMGPSQGGQAALGTGYVQQTYAPDLDFRGIIAIDPESDVEKALPIAGPGIPAISGLDGTAGFFADILAGLRAARPDAAVDDYLSPLGREIIDSIGVMCQPAIDARVANLGIGDLLSKSLSDSRIRAAYNCYMTVPTSGYGKPILLLANVTDTMVPSPLHATLAAQFVAGGVDFRTVLGAGRHTQLNSAMWSAIDDFLNRSR